MSKEISFTIEDLRKIYNMDYSTFLKVLELPNNKYVKEKFYKAQETLTTLLFSLDSENQRKLFNYLNK